MYIATNLVIMKGPHAREEVYEVIRSKPEGTFAKVKHIFAVSLTNRMCNYTTYEEAKTCIVRKRKDRQESVSSISQEPKLVRSNSEERLTNSKFEEIEVRRVSSHEDVPKCSKEEISVDILIHQNNKALIYDDDYEHEQRRSHERFSHQLAPRGRKINQVKKPKSRQFSKLKHKPQGSKENTLHKFFVKLDKLDDIIHKNADRIDQDANAMKVSLEYFLHSHSDEKERTPSPEPVMVSPIIDLMTLHEQVDSTEPVPSNTNRKVTEETETLQSALIASNHLLLSPRNSVIATHRIYLDPNIPQRNSGYIRSKNPIEQRLKDISREVHFLKKKIKKQEEEFEVSFGYKPSHADTSNDTTIKKLYGELNQLRKEHRQLKRNRSAGNLESFVEKLSVGQPRDIGVNLQDTIQEIEKVFFIIWVTTISILISISSMYIRHPSLLRTFGLYGRSRCRSVGLDVLPTPLVDIFRRVLSEIVA